MTKHRHESFEQSLRTALSSYPDEAPIPAELWDVPDSAVRRSGLSRMAAQALAVSSVVIVAALATFVLLDVGNEPASVGGQASAPASISPQPSTTPQGTEQPTSTLERPPAVSVNGVAGKPFSWCYGDVCADGFPTFAALDDLPGVSAPVAVLAAEPASVQGVLVIGPEGVDGVSPRADVSFDGSLIGALPAGDWERLVVAVSFAAGGDAAYVWRLDDPES